MKHLDDMKLKYLTLNLRTLKAIKNLHWLKATIINKRIKNNAVIPTSKHFIIECYCYFLENLQNIGQTILERFVILTLI